MPLSRRDFLQISGAAAVVSAAGMPSIPYERRASLPVVISSANGIRGVALAYQMMAEDGADPLDAALAGVRIQELDPEDQSVGLGGLPNEEGVVQLDASCMHGPTKRAGSVAALEDIATASLVAKAVMDHTDHIMLVGEGAKRFALQMGFEETNLLTEKSRQDWMNWKARLSKTDNWLEWEEVATKKTDGTINMCAVDANGDIGSVTTTSGRSWKIPGRVGDSPIIGAGQYCDNEVGAAGATGRGEAAIKVCASFLIVEFMRQGREPADACLEVLQRVLDFTEDRLFDERGKPLFGLDLYAVRKDGVYGSATIYGPVEGMQSSEFAVADQNGARLEPMTFLYGEADFPDALR